MNTKLVLTAFTAIFLWVGCTPKIGFLNSPVVPAAEGYVKAKQDKNNNFHIEVFVKHLAPSLKLTPPKQYYIVWAEKAENEYQNLGMLKSSSNLISSTLKASFNTTLPYKPISIFITAEDNATLEKPTNKSSAVLTSENL